MQRRALGMLFAVLAAALAAVAVDAFAGGGDVGRLIFGERLPPSALKCP
jgi:hypothetical protein